MSKIRENASCTLPANDKQSGWLWVLLLLSAYVEF